MHICATGFQNIRHATVGWILNLMQHKALLNHDCLLLLRVPYSSSNLLPREMRKTRNHFFYSSRFGDMGNCLCSFPREWGINLSSLRFPKIPKIVLIHLKLPILLSYYELKVVSVHLRMQWNNHILNRSYNSIQMGFFLTYYIL